MGTRVPLFFSWHCLPKSRVNAVSLCVSSSRPLFHYSCVFFLDIFVSRQLRKVAACEAALERVVVEADEAVGSYGGGMSRATSDQVGFQRSNRHHRSTVENPALFLKKKEKHNL